MLNRKKIYSLSSYSKVNWMHIKMKGITRFITNHFYPTKINGNFKINIKISYQFRRAVCLCEILLQIGKNFHGVFASTTKDYQKDCLGRTQCHKWYKIFDTPRTSTN